ncbi:Hypothetical predicted protein [Octopus vulgaris]|uniref:Uncharacterized protein n=1 Tax=Octopus vulgaris TaxID=6645 RepID=A0AA36BVH9_OCTVU|nr:Hypothetical predicted protein [Octopus vulgaris]
MDCENHERGYEEGTMEAKTILTIRGKNAEGLTRYSHHIISTIDSELEDVGNWPDRNASTEERVNRRGYVVFFGLKSEICGLFR